MKKTAIVVPTYNQEDYTIRCFESIARNTDDYVIIWVDNSSSEQSKKKVLELIDKNGINCEQIFLPSNMGFVKATNMGLERALSLNPKYIVLENNDTVVYAEWLERMEKALIREDAGMVGPITSPCNSWQSITHIKGNLPGFEDIPEYEDDPEAYSKILAKQYNNQSVVTENVLAFFSTLIKAEVVQKTGLLSEDFGVGFGDDDDYSNRVMKNGWKLAIAKDVFVFHNHRTTFKSLYTENKIDKMLEENKKIYEKKKLDGKSATANRKRIAIFSHSSGLGGAERSLLFIAQDLSKRGYQLHFFIPDEGPMIDIIKQMNATYTVWSFPWWISDGHTAKEFDQSFFHSVNSLLPEIKKFNPSLVLTNTSVINIGAFLAKLIGVPHVWRVSEFGTEEHGIHFFLDIEHRCKYVSDNSSKVFFISESLRNYYIGASAEKSEVVMNAIEQFPKKDSVHKRTVKDSGMKLLMLGTILPGKGQMDACEAVSKLVNMGYRDIQLEIVGTIMDQKYYSKLLLLIKENGVGDNITFSGYVEDPAQKLLDADVLLMCSRAEAFGRVTLEALVSGVPVIGAKAGATPEIVLNKQNGLLYKVGDSDDLAKKILTLYNDKGKIVKYGKFAKKDALERFNPQKYQERISKILEELAAGSGDSKISDKPSDYLDYMSAKLAKEFADKYNRDIQRLENENKLLTAKFDSVVHSKSWKTRNKVAKIVGKKVIN